MSTRPRVRLGEVLDPMIRPEVPVPGVVYRQLGVRLWGEGAYERESLDGGMTRYPTLSRCEADDVVVNKIWARNGSVAVVPKELSGCYVSSEFPTFSPRRERLDPRWIHWLMKTPDFWSQCDEKSRGTSGKNRIRPERFLEVSIPLPPLPEQRRIVVRIENIAAKVKQIRAEGQLAASELGRALKSVFTAVIADAPPLPMRQVAPIIRRPINVQADAEYPELGVRSFGNGTFHKPAIPGFAVGDKRLYRIEPGDLVFNNVFAWEGAVAVAKPEDVGRVGSHRFITCVPRNGFATAPFLRFFFLTSEGLGKLGSASPGGAGRNRTLGIEALGDIEVPVPDLDIQIRFDQLQDVAQRVGVLRSKASAELELVIPSLLQRTLSESCERTS